MLVKLNESALSILKKHWWPKNSLFATSQVQDECCKVWKRLKTHWELHRKEKYHLKELKRKRSCSATNSTGAITYNTYLASRKASTTYFSKFVFTISIRSVLYCIRRLKWRSTYCCLIPFWNWSVFLFWHNFVGGISLLWNSRRLFGALQYDFLVYVLKKSFQKKFVAYWESCDLIDILLAKKVWKWLLRLIWLNCFNFKFPTILCLQLLSRTEIQDGNAYPATSHALPIPPIQAAGFVPAVLDLWDDRRPTETTRWTNQTFS